jgi:hypothetical protein
VETNAANVVDICNTRHRIPVRSPENSTKYFVLLIARVQILFTFLSVPFVASCKYVGESKQPFHKRLNGHRSDLTKKSFLPVSQHCGLSDHSLEDFNKMKILVIEQNRERFWIKELRVLHPDGIFSFTAFIVNEYFTTVTKFRICAHHLSLTI